MSEALPLLPTASGRQSSYNPRPIKLLYTTAAVVSLTTLLWYWYSSAVPETHPDDGRNNGIHLAVSPVCIFGSSSRIGVGALGDMNMGLNLSTYKTVVAFGVCILVPHFSAQDLTSPLLPGFVHRRRAPRWLAARPSYPHSAKSACRRAFDERQGMGGAVS